MNNESRGDYMNNESRGGYSKITILEKSYVNKEMQRKLFPKSR